MPISFKRATESNLKSKSSITFTRLSLNEKNGVEGIKRDTSNKLTDVDEISENNTTILKDPHYLIPTQIIWCCIPRQSTLVMKTLLYY